ncbi:MAG: sigma-70 family RNA polymerase sigma factor [Deltaproteobacteria bacterium]|nr:MAG: sigma-70 family RNA polymerase sigma factor [Deltaproteobacteria bacterium]
MRILYARLPDEKLMLLLRKGKEGAFDVLFRRHFGKLYGFFLRSTGNRHTAEDLAQEVLVRLFRSAGRYEPTAKFSTFLYTIARNVLLNYIRDSRKKDPEVDGGEGELTPFELSLETTPSSCPDPSEILEKKETLQVLEKALSEMPENLRTPFLMAQGEGMSYREIGEVMGISEGAVKLRIFRARAFLAERFDAAFRET